MSSEQSTSETEVVEEQHKPKKKLVLKCCRAKLWNNLNQKRLLK